MVPGESRGMSDEERLRRERYEPGSGSYYPSSRRVAAVASTPSGNDIYGDARNAAVGGSSQSYLPPGSQLGTGSVVGGGGGGGSGGGANLTINVYKKRGYEDGDGSYDNGGEEDPAREWYDRRT